MTKIPRLVGAEYVGQRIVYVPAMLRLNFLANGDLDGTIIVEDPDTGAEIGDVLLTPGSGFTAAAQEFYAAARRAESGPTQDTAKGRA